MADVILTAEKRTGLGSGPAGRLRRDGKVPAVVYGLDTETLSVTVSARELAHILGGESGANTLITLSLDGEKHLTLARQIQRHPTRGELVHVDFIRIRRDVAVAAEVPVHVVGEAPGTREGGLVEQLIFSLAIEAMPADIPTVIEVDVSGLDIGGQLHVLDLTIPAAVTVHHDVGELVVQVSVPRIVVEEEEVAVEGEEGELAEGAEAPEAGAGAEGAGAPAAGEGAGTESTEG